METSGWNWLTFFEHKKTGQILNSFSFCDWLHAAIFMGTVAIRAFILNLTFLVLISSRVVSFCPGRTPCMLRMKREVTSHEGLFQNLSAVHSARASLWAVESTQEAGLWVTWTRLVFGKRGLSHSADSGYYIPQTFYFCLQLSSLPLIYNLFYIVLNHTSELTLSTVGLLLLPSF